MRNDDVQDLISQLNRLQFQQTELITRLVAAVSNETGLSGETEQEHDRTGGFEPESEADRIGAFAPREAESEPESQEPTAYATSERVSQEPRAFSIGDYVAIKNPNPFQVNTGTITKIGKRRITVTTPTGQKILRAPKNLTIKPTVIR